MCQIIQTKLNSLYLINTYLIVTYPRSYRRYLYCNTKCNGFPFQHQRSYCDAYEPTPFKASDGRFLGSISRNNEYRSKFSNCFSGRFNGLL